MEDLRFGLEITAIGMGLVFGLLGLLWAALAGAGRLEQALQRRRARPQPGSLSRAELAAIAIAVRAHAELCRAREAPGAAPGGAEGRAPAPRLEPANRWVASTRGTQVRSWTRGR